LPIASRFLDSALQYDVKGTLATTLDFFLGLALSFQVFEGLETLDKTKSCELVQEKLDMAERGPAALTIGKAVSPPTTDQLLPYLARLKGDLPKYKAAWKCP